MIPKSVVFMAVLVFSFHAFSQPISLPKLYTYMDTNSHYYLTFCEQYYSLFGQNRWYNNYNYDTCKIDFEKYDLKGIKENDEIKWELVSPKKYLYLSHNSLPYYDSIQWNVFPRDIIIEDTAKFNALKKKMKQPLNDTFDFKKTTLIFNDISLDCHGHFYYKIQYDPLENTIICNIIEIYGGCRGMKWVDSWITIDKPKPDSKIVVKEFWIN